MARAIADEGGSYSVQPTPTPPPYDKLSKVKGEPSYLPSASDFVAVHNEWLRLEEIRTRTEFHNELAGFKQEVINAIKGSYVNDPIREIFVSLPEKIKQRTDLLDSEIVAWITGKGWQCQYDAPTQYANYLRISVAPS